MQWNLLINTTLVATLLVGGAMAQEPPESANQEPTFKTNVPIVLVPVTVTGKHSRFVEGLQASDFEILVDGKPRKFQVDPAEAVLAHLSIVFVVQTNDLSREANLKVRRVGSLVQPLLTGDRGRAAVIGYGDESVMLADFTRDPAQLAVAFERTVASQGSNLARQVDAVMRAAQMLAERPADERKIIIILGESKDRGSRTPLANALKLLQREAITVYAATWSPYKTAFTSKEAERRAQEQSAQQQIAQQIQYGSAAAMPHITPQGSGTEAAGGGVNILSGASEVGRLLQQDSARLIVEHTGGDKLGFATLKKLEEDLSRMGEALHNQYMISFTASDSTPGYHALEVKLTNPKGRALQARSGYWVGEITAPVKRKKP